ncbi:DUF3084 domain-containing protein [Candidatus Saganbacteria bacterium]|nr:DUF3084 domain-containing protein [Candidatus Saganbacteria bacterium]
MNIVIVLLIVSGIVAYVGNYIGRFFGKRRLSIFGLRPRQTATIFTVLSGILIALLTFGSVLLISRDARTALFGLEKLRGDISRTQQELAKKAGELEAAQKAADATRQEIADLLATKKALLTEVETSRSRAVVFSAGQDIYIGKIVGGQGREAAEAELKKLLDAVDAQVKKYRIADVEVDRSDYASTVSYTANTEGDIVVQLISIRNVNVGGTLQVKFEVSPNRKVFEKGEEIAYIDISGKLSQPEIEQKIKELLSLANFAARNHGVIPQATGSLGEVPYSKIFETGRRIKGYDALTRVSILAASDTYTIGPLEIDFQVKLL